MTREEKDAARAELVRTFMSGEDTAPAYAKLREWVTRPDAPASKPHGGPRGPRSPETLAKMRAAGAKRRRANIQRRLASGYDFRTG